MDNHANRRNATPKLLVKKAGDSHFEVIASRTRSFKKGDLVPDGGPTQSGKKATDPGIASQYKRAAEMCMTTGEGQETISLAEAIKSYSEAADFYEAAGDKRGAANACRSLARCREESGDKMGAAQAYVKATGYFKEIGDETSAVDMRANAVACSVRPDTQDTGKPPVPVETAAPPQVKAPPTVEVPKRKLTLKERRALASKDEEKAKELSARRDSAAAASLLSEAAALYRTINNKLRSAKCEYEAGREYRAAGNREKAAEAFGNAAERYAAHYEGRKKAPKSEECEIIGHAFHHSAEFMVEMGRWETAAEQFVKSAAWYERCDEPEMGEKQMLFLKWHSCGSSLMMAGRCYVELGWKKQAAEAYTMASEAYHRGGDDRHAKEALGKAHMADGFAAKVLAGLNELADFLTGAWARH